MPQNRRQKASRGFPGKYVISPIEFAACSSKLPTAKENMKTKSISLICALTVASAALTPARAAVEHDMTAVAADAIIARPLCFGATIVGAAIFVVSLPISLTSHSVKSSAKVLVGTPGKATFVRPLGDFDYYDTDPKPMHAKKQ
jgi:hypothetical protein